MGDHGTGELDLGRGVVRHARGSRAELAGRGCGYTPRIRVVREGPRATVDGARVMSTVGAQIGHRQRGSRLVQSLQLGRAEMGQLLQLVWQRRELVRRVAEQVRQRHELPRREHRRRRGLSPLLQPLGLNPVTSCLVHNLPAVVHGAPTGRGLQRGLQRGLVGGGEQQQRTLIVQGHTLQIPAHISERHATASRMADSHLLLVELLEQLE